MAKPVTRMDIKFWVYLGAIIIPIVVWGVSLQGTVDAMKDKGVKLRQEVESDRGLLFEINERTIRMEEQLNNAVDLLNTHVIEKGGE